MKYKFISETEVKPFKGGFIVYDNKIYTNPTEETLTMAGYKDLVVEPEPEFDPETQCVIHKYIDGDVITQTWEVISNIGETENADTENSVEMDESINETE